MKHSLLLLIFTLSILTDLKAQVNNKFAGIYSLEKVREVGSGFKLNEDSTFEFYYLYGALDRYGSGKWSINNDRVIFNSAPYPGNDFRISDSSLIKGNFTTIKIEDENPSFYSFVYCSSKLNHADTLLNADADGVITVPGKVDTIKLLFELTAERISVFPINRSKYNSYTFKFQPWISEVFFKSFSLNRVSGDLEGKHPLLDGVKYTYKKEEVR